MKKALMVTALAAIVAQSAYADTTKAKYDDLTATMNVIQVIGTIDPAKITDYTEYMMAVNLYDGLTTADKTGKIIPLLAKSWDISKDGKTFTFHLVPDAKFQNGDAVTADDVVYSVQRMLTLNQGPSGFFSGFLEPKGVSAVDKHTVQFKLKEASSAFLGMSPLLFVVDKSVADQHKGKNGWAEKYLAAHAEGTGPYSLDEWQRGSRIVFKRNHNYFYGFPEHPLEKVRVLVTSDESTIKALANKGELDLSSDYQAEETLKAIGKLPNYHIQDLGSATGYYIKFNNQRAPTDDVHIRKAIALAIDYDLVNKELYPGNPMSGPLASLFKGAYLDSLQNPTYDLKKAAAEVKLSKYAGQKIPITLGYVAGSAYEEEISLMMQANLESIGFKVKLEGDPWSRITQIASKPETTPNVNQIFFGPTYASPQSVFYNQYSSKSAGSWASMSWLNDKKVDQWIDDAGRELNTEKRNAIYHKLQKYIVDNQVDAFLQTTRYRMAVNNCLSDMKFVPIQSFYYDFSKYNWKCVPTRK